MRSLAAGLTSMVDVIDPKHGAVIYSQPFDEPPPQIIGDGVAYTKREDANGNLRVEVF